jgi:hypothetical protein
MPSNRQNCWEYMNCGREPGGDKTAEFGICRVASAKHLNETNSGLNGGRVCFAIVGSFCEGEIQGTFAKKFSSCRDCEFYKLI